MPIRLNGERRLQSGVRCVTLRSCGKSTSWGDSSPKHIAFRRSTDGGASWSPTLFIVRSDGTNDNL